MEPKGTLREFLDANRSDGVWTHTALNGGKFFIPDDKLDQFYSLYTESILDQEKQYLTEKCTEIGPLRVDFDFIYDTSVVKHQHTRDQVLKFCKVYMDEVCKYVITPEPVDIYIMEKRKPTFDLKKNRMKSGIHIVVPNVSTHKFIEQRVRRNLLKTMDEYFTGLPTSEPWDKIYDEAVVNRSVPWTIYGSRKNDPNALPYLVSYTVCYADGKCEISDKLPKESVELMKLLSLRRDASHEAPMTEEAKLMYSGLQTQQDIKISGGRAVTPARGRPSVRGDKPSSRGSSPNARALRQLEPEEKEYYKDHVMNLNPERADSYAEWVNVGLCLHNIHPDLLDVFLDFSAQSEKYNEADCIQKWNKLTFLNDGERLKKPTLLFWSRSDDLMGYTEIEERNFQSLLNAAASGTEHDVARVVQAKFMNKYVCSEFGKNVWFRWAGHIWVETDKGIDLQLKLSSEIAKAFLARVNKIGEEMVQQNRTACIGGSKDNCGVCDFCKDDKARDGMNKIFTKLKTTKFKDNVMKECRELFFDEQFTKKLDSNKDLIAFNNGVMDLTTYAFRDGCPEDYLSFSTGIDYDPEKKYYEYEHWNKIQTFLAQVLPDKEVREYFIRHLSTCIIGGNKAQKFHILTGSGSNGKSMLMNLMSKALGDYAAVVPISLFTQNRNKSGAAAPEVIRLKGRRFVTMQEPDEKIALNTGLMKEISSCEKMYARDLFKSGCEFEVQAKFHLACNDKPAINTTDGGTWRRLMVINFTSKFVDKPTEPYHYPIDETIQHAVNSVDWATPFLSYIIQTLKDGKGFHKLQPPSKVMEYTSDYRNDNDGIAKFITERLEVFESGDEVHSVSKETLRSVFKQWKIQNEQLTLTPSELEKRIVEQFGKYPKGGWCNFRIAA